ncbi:hypothetical protein [Streptococcus sp. NLN64]|uniref:hypothetical protein n=1 Tax=Streptococcus sp. NLN64 TaxID=2822799 RepID=UPI0018CB067D|nr:hypothetical protein [Streptococcus sp. NLN64]MBG9366846.1 hypothetical protein [Streptococcus sp. NLN64]
MRTLLIGNTSYVTETFIQESFPQGAVFIFGESEISAGTDQQVTVVSPAQSPFSLTEILEAYDFQQVVFFSDHLTYKNPSAQSLASLRELLAALALGKASVSKFLYLTGPQVQSNLPGLMDLELDLLESWQGRAYKVLQLPYLFSTWEKEPYFAKILGQAQVQGRLEFMERENQEAPFAILDTLSSLIYRVLDSWDGQTETLTWFPSEPATFGEIADILQKNKELTGYEIYFRGQEQELYQPIQGNRLTDRYQWSEPVEVMALLPQLGDLRVDEKVWVPVDQGTAPWVDYVLLLLGALLAQGLQLLVAQQSFSLSLSFPLLYLVLVAQARGMKKGFLAMGVVLLLQVAFAQGQALSLLSSAAFWLQFLAYVLATALAGYLQMQNLDRQATLRAEQAALMSEHQALQENYRHVLEDRQSLRYQILSERGGFGYFATLFNHLAQAPGEALFSEALSQLDTKIQARDMGIYRFDQGLVTAHLVVGKQEGMPQKIDLSALPRVATRIQEGSSWVNADLLAGYPAYAVSIKRSGQVAYLLWIEGVDFQHMNLQESQQIEFFAQLLGFFLEREEAQKSLGHLNGEG